MTRSLLRTANGVTLLVAFLVFFVTAPAGGADIDLYYTDLENEANPSWFSLIQTLDMGENSLGPAFGSSIEVNQVQTNQGPYANRNTTSPVILHSPTHSAIQATNFDMQTRWYQEYGNTQIFRLFPGDDNVRNDRIHAPRSEAFSPVSWKRGDGWYEWSGRYTFLKVRPGAVLQIKHNDTYWSLQLVLDEMPDGTFDLSYVKLRNKSDKTLLMEDVVGKGVDIKVLDNGEDHMVYVNGELKVVNKMTDRPLEDDNRARWGLYTPRSAMDRDILIFVTGAYVGPEGGGSSPVSDYQMSAWQQFVSWLDPIGDYEGRKVNEEEQDKDYTVSAQKFLRMVDKEPNQDFLEKWYADPANAGYGYF